MLGSRLLEATFLPRDPALTPTASPCDARPAGAGFSAAAREHARAADADLHGEEVYRDMLLRIFSACLSGVRRGSAPSERVSE